MNSILSISTAAAVVAAALSVTSTFGQSITLQKQNSIALGGQFLTGGAFGDFPLSVAYVNGNAYVGGFNSPGGAPGSVGVVRIDNVLSSSTTFNGLASSQFTAGASRGIDGLSADSTGVYLAYDDGNGSSAFVRKYDLNGNQLWDMPSTSIVGGYRPTAIAIDPKASNGAPALGVIGNGSGRRVALDLSTGTVIYGPTGFAGPLGEIVNPNPTSVNGVSLGSGYRGLAFDSLGNIAVTAAGGTSYGTRDTQGDTNFNRFLNPLDNASSQTRPILVKQTSAGAAAFVAQGVQFIEGLGTDTLLAVSERVGGTFALSLSTATDKSGGFTTQNGLDSRNLFIRKVDGSVPTNLVNANLVGDEDGLSAAFSADLKNIAIARDASNNPVLLVLSYSQKRLDVYGIEPQWTNNADGNWSDTSKWTLGIVPDSSTTNATFSTGITSPRTITLDSARTVKQVKFDNANRVTISGTSTLTLGAPTNNGENILPAYLTAKNGSHTINAPIVLASNARFDVTNAADTLTLGSVDGSGRGLTKRGAGKLEVGHIRVSTLALAEGATVVKANGAESGISRVATLQLNGGTLDLTNNGLIVDYPSADPSPYNDLGNAMLAGTITSSLSDSSKTLGIIERGSSATPTFTDPALIVDSTTVLIRFTLRGDTNLDKTVNFDDLLALAQNYGATGSAQWAQGDTNYNGTVDFDDLLSLAQNYGGSLALAGEALGNSASADFNSDFALALSLVPEPASLGLLGGLAVVGLRRRK
jgi:hypothetical protein